MLCATIIVRGNDILTCSQLNEVTPWIDGGLVYGTSKVWANELRSFKGGKLAKSDKGNWPAENDIGLPMDNPPPPTKHELLNSERLFSKFVPFRAFLHL